MVADTHLPLASRVRNRYLFGSDLLLFASSTILAFALRFEGFEWGAQQTHAALLFLLASLPLKLAIFWRVGIYRRLWRYAGVVEVERLISASVASGLVGLLLGAAVLPGLGLTDMRVPLSVLFMDGLLTAAFAAMPRFGVR
ncbi:MAG TPA: hypothetical protein VFG66_11190, partial [Gemmatimonadales bacterium]|nr:hypothetical protein [Gemmatimonadales bacterium]